jgi:hypothetical protein
MKIHKPALPWVVLGLSALVFFVSSMSRFRHASNDFVPVYTGARCLLHGCNPYQPSQLEQEFFAGAGKPGEIPSWEIDMPVYPPSTFLALVPLGLLKFPTARWVWYLLNGSLFVLAAAAIFSLCPQAYRWPAALLISFLVGSAGILLVLGQPGTFAISVSILGICLFLRGRLLWLATAFLLAGLAVKPQIGGFLVLYLFVRGIHRRYAAFALLGAGALLVCGGLILRHAPQSADWKTTLQNNLTSTLSPGGSADPRPGNTQAIGDINLQSLSSIFFPTPGAFNAVAYLCFVGLLGAGVGAVVRAPLSLETNLVALAALSVLSLLPVYHRFYDTRLLLLSVPGAMMVLHRRRTLGVVILVLTVLSSISLQYRLQINFLQKGQWQNVVANKFLLIALLRQQNLELLLLYVLYVTAIFSLRFAEMAAPQTTICSFGFSQTAPVYPLKPKTGA